MKQVTLPNGMHDKLFKRARVTYEIERNISDFLMAQGFNRIDTPTLEHFEVFGDSIEASHYHLFDKKGHLLALRPDVTSQIGRVIASTRVHTPTKFSYSGKVFHYNEELRGLANELSQAGIEIIGYPVRQAVLEAIQSAKQSLDLAQVRSYQFEFSHAAILKTILEKLKLDEQEEARLLDHIRKKNMTGLYEFTQANPSEFDEFLQKLPCLFGPSRQVLDQARKLLENQQILAALDDLEDMLVQLSDLLPASTMDLGQVASMPYYTGLTFKVFGEKVPAAFLSGGRYDQLFERFGADQLTAVGWTLDIDSVYQAIHDDLPDENGKEGGSR
ncbi:ATP phosphoribosyltransferase regulatory subunit [Streptococcus panodentis]|uniref:ATP phosphoribosyltransferase regulatory subunit n=1 Tax=Streptococcus panodentis TaxID=1581472 RepID=A0ABS5AUX3_9STRE|nr:MULTISPECIES: ATP phosphoribosyltransferase regulatory subunit [Streptococcus]KXT84122.1 ATP phosphoribosyltransferase regulatory subunit [Streptococcus sp. DD11]MBP2620367.1 ATP phosphoribosyltransferase regulatory subunit [Streptococcus panodentis]